MWCVDDHVIKNEKDVEGTTVLQAMKDAKALCAHAEALPFFTPVFQRIEAVHDELQTKYARVPAGADKDRAVSLFTNELVKFIGQLQFYCETSFVGRVLYHKRAIKAMKEIHEGARDVYGYYVGGLDNLLMHIRENRNYPTDWKEGFEASEKEFEEAVAQQVEQPEVLEVYKSDALQALEAATLLRNAETGHEARYEWYGNPPAQRLRELLKSIEDSDTIVLPDWFVPESEINYRSRQFASGSYGAVHYGTWRAGANVVVKVLLTNGKNARLDAKLREKFIEEAELWSKISHPYVLKLWGACHVTAPPFFVCEDATNGDLKSYLTTEAGKAKLWRLLFQSALAIEYLHGKRIIHGDLKLNNILVGADGYARVTDFSLSRFKKPSRNMALTRQESLIEGVGALRWRAPETLAENKAQFASDVYSFGLCLIEALSGETPYEALEDEDVKEHIKNHKLPPKPEAMSDDIWKLVEKMTEPEPNDRASIKQVTEVLKKLANEELTKELEKTLLCQICQSRLVDGADCPRCQRPTPTKPVGKEVGPILSKEDLPRVIELVTLSDSRHEHKAPNALRDYMFGQPDHQRYVFEAGAIPVLAKVMKEEDTTPDAQLEALTAVGCTMVTNKKILKVAMFEDVIDMLKDNVKNNVATSMKAKSVLVLGFSAHGNKESQKEVTKDAEVMNEIKRLAEGSDEEELPAAAKKALMFLAPEESPQPAEGA